MILLRNPQKSIVNSSLLDNLSCNRSFPAPLCFSSRWSPQKIKIPLFSQHPFLRIYQPPKPLNLFQKGKSPLSFIFFSSFLNLLSFLLFPFLSENQNPSLFLCMVFSFHMYAATLILFFLQKYFSYLLWVYMPLWELNNNPHSLVKQ